MELREMEPTTCSCRECADLCRRRPCWPTPGEARAIMDAGHADRLMADYWVRSPDDITIIGPAIVGYEGCHAPFWPEGRCTFLTDEGLCELHDAGLKPLEGRLADPHNDEQSGIHLHELVAMTWDNETGRSVAESWNPRRRCVKRKL